MYNKIKLYELRERIKKISKEQKSLKAQRKEKYQGERKYSQGEATDYARSNKHALREMHVAYSMLLGRTIEEIERKTKPMMQKEPVSMYSVNEIIEGVSDEIVCLSA